MNEEPDVFAANKCYPEAKDLFFSGYQSLADVRDSCLVVLDTNALLVPYGISKNGLAEIESTYQPLAATNRLVVPGQVAREFAKNRPFKIGDIFQAISRKQNIASPKKGRYPMLDELPTYERVRELESQIGTLIAEYRDEIGKLLDHIKTWNWDDPVSNLYSKLFPASVVDPVLKEGEIRERLSYLKNNKLPPGYKDAGKLDDGVGDLLVWKAAVQVAEERKLPVVLVSGDSKSDWFYRSEGQPLFPRYELVDEIRRVTDGKSFHIVSFAKFLELFGATAAAVEEARTEEVRIDLSTMSSYGRNSILASMAEQAVANWINTKYVHLEISRDDRIGGIILSEPGGAAALISVKYHPASQRRSVHSRIRETLVRFERLYNDEKWGICLLYTSPSPRD